MRVPIVELPPEAFPMTVEFFSIATGAKVWETTVQEPVGTLHRLRIPPLVHAHGPVRARISYADGDVYEAETQCDQSVVDHYAALMADADVDDEKPVSGGAR